MRHGLMYQGSFENNYSDLRPGVKTYRSTDGVERTLHEWPSDIDGLRVGYMERAGKRFVAVRLQYGQHDIVLGNPLVLDPMRHTGGKRFSPEPTLIDDEVTSTLLDDVLRQNQDQSSDIALLINKVNQTRRAPS